jgi:hypothetical protein
VTDDLQADTNAEVDALQQGFRDQREAEQQRFNTIVDGNYYFCVVFEDGLQADAFLKHFQMLAHQDLFVDGRVLAQRCGVELPASTRLKKPPVFRVDKKLASLSETRKATTTSRR